MKKLFFMIALAAISFGSVYAHAAPIPVRGHMQTDTTMKKKKKKMKKDTTMKPQAIQNGK